MLAGYWDRVLPGAAGSDAEWRRTAPGGDATRRARAPRADVIVVGAGLAGLCCARELDAAGLDVLVLERGDAPGGRVRTDEVDGFLLDRGFQVFLTAYPEARRVLDYERLRSAPVRRAAP